MALKEPNTLSEKQHERVLEYVPFEPGEPFLLFYDDTTLGSAKSGMVFTDGRFIKFDKREVTVVRIADATKIEIVSGHGSTLAHRFEVSATGAPTLVHPMYLDTADIKRLTAHLQPFARPGLEIITGASQAPSSTHRGRTGFILSTTPSIEGRSVEEYLGVVSGEAVLGASLGIDLVGGIADLVGGRARGYEQEFGSARETAFSILEAAAVELGANAVIGIDVDYEVLGASGSMMMVSVNGTAVRLADRPPPYR